MIQPLPDTVRQSLIDAVQKERLIRDVSYLPVIEHICGFEVSPLTLTHYITLKTIESPFLPPFATPDPEDLARFLWLLNPRFSLDAKERKKFMKRCRVFMPPPAPLFNGRRAIQRWKNKSAVALARMAETVIAARAFIREAMQDQPGSSGGNGVIQRPEFYSDATSICAQLAREYGWSEDSILAMPTKRLFQYIKEIRDEDYSKAGQCAPLGNSSDKIMNDYLVTVNTRN